MGGQACVFYGAAEFSRDTDVSPHVRRRSAMTLITIKPVPSNRTRVLGETIHPSMRYSRNGGMETCLDESHAAAVRHNVIRIEKAIGMIKR